MLLAVVASAVLAAAVIARREALVRIAAAGFAVAALIAFVLSRTGDGIFGFAERGLEPSPQAAIVLVAEIAVIVLVAISLLPALRVDADVPVRAAGTTALALVVLVVVAGARWAREDPPAELADRTTPVTVPVTADAGTARPTRTTAASADVVRIVDFAFDAPTLTVPVGTTVEWVNEDSTTHQVVADDGAFGSARLAPGDTFTFTFETAGEFSYACGLHPSMLGSITVTG